MDRKRAMQSQYSYQGDIVTRWHLNLAAEEYHRLHQRSVTSSPLYPLFENEVIALRPWGATSRRPIVDSSAACAAFLGLPDSVSLAFFNGFWRIQDQDRTAGLSIDGVPLEVSELSAGCEISLGRRVLIAESARSIVLHRYCARLLGQSSQTLHTVDLAMRSLRQSALNRTPLVIEASEDAVSLARAIHHRMVRESPFVVLDANRPNTLPHHKVTVRRALTVGDEREALELAHGGTLCLVHPPSSEYVGRIVDMIHSRPVRVFICSRPHSRTSVLGFPLIAIPTLQGRSAELPCVISHSYCEARKMLGGMSDPPSSDVICWITQRSGSMSDIDRCTMRVAALQMSSSVSEAARLLRMAPISLARWIKRRMSRTDTEVAAPMPQFRTGRCINKSVKGESC